MVGRLRRRLAHLSQGTVPAGPRKIVRSGSSDPRGDAQFDFSSLEPTPPPRRENVEPLDLTSLKASASSIGEKKAIKFELKVDGDLSRDALLAAATDMNSAELKFVVRWFSGYRPDYAIANYDVASGTFTFSKGNLSQVHCETTEEGRLEIYPAPPLDRGNPIPGKVDPQTGTITIRVPYDHIQDYDLNRNNLTQFTPVSDALSGDPIWEVTAFTFGRPQEGQPQQGPGGEPICPVNDYYNQADSTASFDYRLP